MHQDPHLLCLLPTGTITMQRPGDGTPKKYVYQRVGKGFGNIVKPGSRDLQLRAHVIGTDPQTAAQVVRRTLFADAVAAYQVATDEVKKNYRARASILHMSGYNLFLKEWMKANG